MEHGEHQNPSPPQSAYQGAGLRIRARLAVVLRDHKAAVHRVRFSPDGSLLVSGDEAGVIMLWDVASRVRVRTFEDRGYLPTFSPDGRSVAFVQRGEAGTGRLETLDGRAIATFAGHSGDVRGIVFSPDGRMLATGDDTGSVRLWDVGHRRLLSSFAAAQPARSEGQSSPRRAWAQPLACVPDGANANTLLLVVDSVDERGTGQVYSITWPGGDTQPAIRWTGALIPAAASFDALACFPGGAFLVYATPIDADLRQVRLRDLAQKSLPSYAMQIRDVPLALAVSPDGRWLAEVTASQGRVGIWDMATHSLALAWPAHTDYYDQPTGGDSLDIVGDMDWSPAGRFIATCGTSPFLPPQPDPTTGRYPPLRGPDAAPPQGPDDFTVKLWEIEREPPWPRPAQARTIG